MLGRYVEHIEGQHDGQPEFEHLADQVQVPLQVRRIHDADDCIDRGRVFQAAEEHVDRLAASEQVGDRVKAGVPAADPSFLQAARLPPQRANESS